MKHLSLLLTFLLAGGNAHARVFSFDNEHLFTYFRGAAGLSEVAKTAFADSSGVGTSFSDEVKYNFSGELGFAVSYDFVTLKLGVEGIVPKDIAAASGSNSSSEELLTVDSELLAVTPVVSLEFEVYRTQESRIMIGAGVGRASLTVKNVYKLTDQGSTDLGVTDYTEEMTGTALGGSIYTQIESHFTDNVTATIEAGYRYYQVEELEHEAAVTTINGAVAAGATATNNDGAKRAIDLSGLFVGVGLRFYIQI